MKKGFIRLRKFTRRIEDRVRDVEEALEQLLGHVAPVPTDPVEFCEKVLNFKPYPYQAEFLRDRSPLRVLRWCRRAGKTTIMTADDIYYAVTHPNSKILVTMPKYMQVKEVYFQDLDAGLHSHLNRMDDYYYDFKVNNTAGDRKIYSRGLFTVNPGVKRD